MATRWEDKIRARAHPIFIAYKFSCAIVIFLLVSLFIIIVLNTTNDKPTWYLQNFYVPALNTLGDSNASRANIIFFDLELQKDSVGVRYDNVNLRFFYGPNTSHAIGNYTIQGFYMKSEKIVHKRDIVVTHGVPWEDALKAVSNGSTAEFRLALSTKFKLKECFIYSKKRRLDVGANVQIDNSGMYLQNKAIKLT